MEWISVKDRLPSLEEYVFVFSKNARYSNTCIGYLTKTGWKEVDEDIIKGLPLLVKKNVLYWMPIAFPEAPKERI